MKVSIIIRTYNRAYIIRDALDSALKQHYRNFEIIVVDDASNDGTREIVESLQSDKVRYIRHDKNRGVSAAGNTGILAATGEVIAFLDSDDLWKPEMLDCLVDFLCRHPESDAVFCDVEIIDGEKIAPSLIGLMQAFPKILARHDRATEYVLGQPEMYHCLLQEVPIKNISVLIRRYVLNKVGTYNESCVSGEDWELYLRISRLFTFGYVDRSLAVQRVCSDSTFLKFREADKLSTLNLTLKEKATIRNDSEAIEAVNRGIFKHCNNLAWIYLHSGQRRKSIATYIQGFKETRDPVLLVRAASALLPIRLRNLIRGVSKRDIR